MDTRLNTRPDTTHPKAFAAAMQRKDVDAMLTHMVDDAVLRTPLVAESFTGKAAIRPVVEALFRVVDAFELIEMMQGPASTYRSSSGLPQARSTWMAWTTGVSTTPA
jgi:hypothetical protein